MAELELKVKRGNFKSGMFIIFENCFLFSKIKKICLVFFFSKKYIEYRNNIFEEQVKF